MAALRPGAGAGQSSCQEEGEGCGLMVGCCANLVCIRLPLNPNAGVCRALAGVAPIATSSGLQPPNTGADPIATVPPTATLPPAPTSTPESTARHDVTVRADCRGPIDTVEIENGGETAVTIFEITTRSQAFERINRRLGPGDRVTFSFGGPDNSGAQNRFQRSLFADNGSGRVEALTSVGVLGVGCQNGSGA